MDRQRHDLSGAIGGIRPSTSPTKAGFGADTRYGRRQGLALRRLLPRERTERTAAGVGASSGGGQGARRPRRRALRGRRRRATRADPEGRLLRPRPRPLILDRLGLTRDDFAPIEHAVMVERDLDSPVPWSTRACSELAARRTRRAVARLRPLVAAGVQHLSFGPPLGPDPLRAVELLGRHVLPALCP